MDWPDTFATKKDIKRLEDQGHTIVPYSLEKGQASPVVFAAIVYSENEELVSGWYYHPKRGKWVEEDRIESDKVISLKIGVFEGGMNVFGEPGKEAEKIRNSIGDTLYRYLGDYPFIYNEESAQALQPSSNAGNCDCSIKQSENLVVSNLTVNNGDDVTFVACGKCGKPYAIQDQSDSILIEKALQLDWVFPNDLPAAATSSGNCTFYHVDSSTTKRTHSVVAALVGEVGSETQFSQDYNAKLDEFFLISVAEKIVGYLSWHTKYDKPSITQLYVRPEARGNDYAKTAIREWCDYITGSLAYAEHMNEASRPIFRELGLLKNGESEFAVKEFTGVDAQKRMMDTNFYRAYPTEAFPDEFGVN
ncbi:GNAT family N-acetyltransferase [Halorubrum salinum]|uniref:GNAT family N-acetyltransferase n=1 Tax=Halorubrum salinum TaxID=767517 RepID=UPI002111A59B|nr:GNAT family N-acetyltransferase [Halorubrum salinum]